MSAETDPRAESPFGKPLDPSVLAEPAPQHGKPLPKGLLTAIAIPAASMAGAVLLQKALEGPLPSGDVYGRWLLLSSLVGAPLGAIAGLALARSPGRRLLWIVWGALAPVLLAALIAFGVLAAHPLRETLALRAADKCRLTRQVCSLHEFRGVCTEAGTGPRARERAEAKLGPPAQSLCRDGSCTHRWLYAGPWTPDNWVAPGSIFCSVVVDAQGTATRSALTPGPEAP